MKLWEPRFAAGLISMILISGVLLSPTHAVRAAPPQAATIALNAEAGFGGYARRQSWVPVRVSISSNENVEGELVVDDGQPEGDQFYIPLALTRNTRRLLTLYTRARANSFNVRFIAKGGGELVNLPMTLRNLNDEDRLVVVASEPLDGYNFLGELRTPSGGRTYVAQMNPAQLPDRSAALSSIDQLILSNIDTAQFSEGQRQSLRAWVVSGGQLIVAGGPGARVTLAGLGDLPGARLAPGLPTGLNDPARAWDNLLAYAGTMRVNRGAAISSTANLALANLQLSASDAQVLISASEAPLIVRRRIGRGLVDQLAFDATIAPLRDWPDRSAAFGTLFGGRVGIPNTSTQLRNEASAYRTARMVAPPQLPSPLWISLFLLAYVLLIGPLNYLLLRKINRFAWAWLTMPAITALFTAAGLGAAIVYRGTGAQINRISVAYGDALLAEGNAQTLVAVMSTRRVDFDVEAGRALVEGLRENPQTPAPLRLREGATNQLRELPISSGSVRAFYARGDVQMPRINTELVLTPGTGFSQPPRITGNIVNASSTALNNCALVAGGDQIYLAERVAPGQSMAVDMALTNSYNRPVLFPPVDRLSAAAFGGVLYTSATSRVGKLFGRDVDLAKQLLDLRGLPAGSITAQRARDLLNAAIGDTRAQINQGLSLACWEDADRSGISTSGARATDLGLRIWELHPRTTLVDQNEAISAAMLSWNIQSAASSITAGPGELRMDAGRHVMAFTPWMPLRLGSDTARVNARLEFTTATQRRILRDSTLWAYDWQTREYVRLRQFTGNTTEDFSFNGRHLSSTGEMRLMLELPPDGFVELTDLKVEALVQ